MRLLSFGSFSRVLSFSFLILFCFMLTFPCFAANYSLYSSVSSTDSTVNNLVGIYLNQSNYDPFNEYFCCRTGQYDYYLFYGQNLAEDYNYIHYQGVQNGYGTIWSFTFGTGEGLSVTTNGYTGVGNVEHSIISERAEHFKYQFIIISLAVLFAVIGLWKLFRNKFNLRRDKGWVYG